MADLSDSSEELWSCLKQETEAWYALYLATDPLSRLSLRTDPSPALMSSKWNRTRTRMESMILEASPSEVKEEISAARIAGIFPVMCRLYVIFGPGSLQEREEGLRRLTNPQAAKSPKEAVAELRSWRRWCSRFVSLGGTLPDPSILLKALNTITAKPLQDFPEIQFRISLTRASLQVDVLPTSAKVDQLHQHLLSELEVVSRLKSGDACKAQAIDTPGTSAPQKPPKLDPSKDKPKPEPKAVAVPKGGAGDEVPASSEDCRAFLRGGQGCRYGGKCRRPHNWASIPKDRRANLCINCGGEGHRADGCARPKRDKPGDSSSAPSPAKKPPNPPKPKGNLPDAQQVQGLVTGAAKLLEALGSTPKAPPPARDTTLPTQAGAAQAQAVPIAGTPVLSLDALQEQLASLQNQLAQGSQAQAKVVAEVASLDHQTAEVSDRALLDSGATHAVSATCNGPTFPCEVALAGDQVQVWRKNACGTLNPPSTEGSRPQTLLPLGQLVGRLGCKVSWCRRKGLRLNHPKRGPLQTFLSAKGCPELPETMAQELIRELEDQQTSEFQSTVARTIGAIQANAGGSSSQALVEYVREGSISRATAALLVCPALRGFEQAQVLELAQAVSSGDADGWRLLKDLPYTRRLRKRLFKNQWWVNFGPKVSRSLSDAIAQRGYCVLEASELVGKAELIPVLLWACATGRFAGSMCWGGASPVPLSESQELWSRWFWAVASVFQGVCLPFLVEGVAHQDQRTREFARWGQAWTVQFSETRVAATNLDLRHVDSRVLHDLQGTACLETEIQRALCGEGPSLPYLAAASALPDASTPGPVPDVEAIGIEEAGSGAQPGDLDSFGEEFLRDLEALIDKDVGQDVPGEPPEDPKNLSLPMSMQDLRAAEPDPNDLSEKDKSKVAMSPKERASWRRHITAGHLPYRRDCLACTMGAGLGIQHRRVRFKDSFSMSWDISGPFREVGKTGKHSGFRYLFVAGVRVPTCLFRDAATSAPGPSANKPDPGSPTLQSSTPGQVAAPAQSPQQGELDWNSDYSPTEGGEIDPDILFSELEPPAVEEEESLPEHLPPIEAPAPKVESVLDEGPSMSDDEIDKMVASLRHPVDQVLLRFAVPLRNRQSKSLLSAIQYVVTETNRLGIPIKICHSDKEGQSEEIQSWLRQNCIVPSNTQGADAKSNGLAERLVSWFKARMRLHLTAGKVPVQFWPYAAQFASQDHLDGLLDRRPPQLTFGRQVLFRAKAMTNEAKKVFSTWEWGRYLGRSMISAEGHHILKDSTGAVITSRSVRAGLVDVDDELLEPLVAEDPKPVVMPVPPHRLREKTYVAKVAEQELMAEEQASKLLRSGNITPQAVSRMLQHLVQEPAADMKRRGHSSGHWYLGGFRRGPFSGITKATNGLPQVLQVLNQFLLGKARAKGVPDFRWVSVGLFANPEVPVHRDFHNEGSNFGLVIPGITNLWTEEALNSSSVPAGQLAPRQATAPGYLTPLKPGLQFNPKTPHAVVRTPEWVVVGYTPNGFSVDVERDRLQALGFRVPDATRGRIPQAAVVSPPLVPGPKVQDDQVPASGVPTASPSVAAQGIRPLEHVPGVPGALGLPTGAFSPVAAQGVGPLEHVPGVPGEAGLPAAVTPAISTSLRSPAEGPPASNTTTISEPSTGSNASLPNLQAISEKKGEVIPAAQACPAWLPRLSATRADPSPRITSGPSQLKSVEPAVIENIEAHLADLDANGRKLEITHTASPKEARQHLEKWKESMEEELNGQLASGCLTRRDGEEARQLLKRPDAEVLSSLNVWTVKPPKPNSNKMYRRKVRTVACGNQSEVTSEVNTYASGARAEYVRLALSLAANNGWDAFTTDISQAFLLAPKPEQRTILLRPTREHVSLGLASPTELWEVNRAVYGLRESPKWWSTYRDSCLRTAAWDNYHLEATSCDSMWTVKDDKGATCGIVVTYVDDFLILGNRAMASGFRSHLSSEFGWASSELEGCEQPGDSLKFLGMEIERLPQGYRVHQRPYIEQLLSAYDVGHPVRTPLPRIQEEPDVVPSSPESLKQAQKVLGELLWISQRSRPDVSFSVSLLASWVHRNAQEVIKLALRVLSYVATTKEECLHFERQSSRGEPPLVCYTDASFSPYGGRSVSGLAIVVQGCLVSWRANKQAFVVLSSSEAELVSATEGVVQAQSLMPLLQELGTTCKQVALRVDNTSAIHLLHGRGANRTRHLRVRAAYVSELIESGEVAVEHQPGKEQLADAFTKILPSPRLCFLKQLLKLRSENPGPDLGEDTVDEDTFADEAPSPQIASADVARDLSSPRSVASPSVLASVSRWLTGLVTFCQATSCAGERALTVAPGVEEEAAEGVPLGIRVDFTLATYLGLLIVLLVALCCWEGVHRCSRPQPLTAQAKAVRHQTRKSKKIEEKVQEAVAREIQGLRHRGAAQTSSGAPASPESESASTLEQSAPSSQLSSSAGRSAEVPALTFGPVVQPISSDSQPPSSTSLPFSKSRAAPASSARSSHQASPHLSERVPTMVNPMSAVNPGPSKGSHVRPPTLVDQEVQTVHSGDLAIPLSALNRGIPTGSIMTTMQRGGVVHLYDDCSSLGVPAYRQTRTFCRTCLHRVGLGNP